MAHIVIVGGGVDGVSMAYEMCDQAQMSEREDDP